MMRTMGMWLLGAILVPAEAVAQSSVRPAVEVGVEVTAAAGADGNWRALAPRLSLNANSRTAIEATFARQATRDGFTAVDYTIVRMKQTLVSTDRGGLFGTLGGALSRKTYSQRLIDGYPGGFSPERSLQATFGFGGERELGAHLAVRAEAEYVLGQETLFRYAAGITIPLGRYVDRSRANDSLALAATPARLVRIGQNVWISSRDGREMKGEIVDRSVAGLTIRHRGGSTAVAMSDILTIDAPDGLGNGIINGAIAGGISGASFGWVGGRAWCEEDGGCVSLSMLIVGALGGGIGTLTGAVVDSFREGRRPVYDARVTAQHRSVSLVPILATRGAGLGATVVW